MATADLIVNVNRGLDQIENHIRGAGTPLTNPANIIDGIRGSLNTIRVTLQNITAERDQYQNLLNDENGRIEDLRNELRDTRNQFFRSERLLEESRAQMQRSEQTYKNTYWGLRENWQLAQDRKERIGGLLRENFIL